MTHSESKRGVNARVTEYGTVSSCIINHVAEVVKEAMWLVGLVKELGIKQGEVQFIVTVKVSYF